MIGYIFTDKYLALLRGDRTMQGRQFLVPVMADAMPVEYPRVYDPGARHTSLFFERDRRKASYLLRIKLKPNPYVGRL